MSAVLNFPALREQAPEPIAAEAASVRFRPDALRRDVVVLGLTSGITLISAVRQAFRDAGYRRMPRGASIFVSNDGFSPPYEVPRSQWNTFMVRHGMKIMVTVPRLQKDWHASCRSYCTVKYRIWSRHWINLENPQKRLSKFLINFMVLYWNAAVSHSITHFK